MSLDRSKKAPKVPRVLVELGRAVELRTVDHIYTWSQRDNWIVCSSISGRSLFIMKRPRGAHESDTLQIKKGERLYKVFNHQKSDQVSKGRVSTLQGKEGRAKHIIYNSDKFGKSADYIHEFDRPPIVWLDSPRGPKLVGLTGGNITITTRGIEG